MKRSEKKTTTNHYSEGKHQKAKQNFLNKKGPKGNKGNMKWENFGHDF